MTSTHGGPPQSREPVHYIGALIHVQNVAMAGELPRGLVTPPLLSRWSALHDVDSGADNDPLCMAALVSQTGGYFGASRIAPSSRITSPLSISLMTMACTSLA
jgi:hypothetical protein